MCKDKLDPSSSFFKLPSRRLINHSISSMQRHPTLHHLIAEGDREDPEQGNTSTFEQKLALHAAIKCWGRFQCV